MLISGRYIRAGRALAGWSQAELAARAGVHEKTVLRCEHMDAAPERARAPSLLLAALKAAGVEVAAEPRPALFFVETRAP